MRGIRGALVALLLQGSGCTNAIYFYETEKISFTAEARPDSSQPIQGSFGIKQRVAVVSPQRKTGNGEGAESEAASMIASFRFDKRPGGIFDLGPLDIRTALVTGDAASSLSEPQAQQVAMAVSGASERSSAGEQAKKHFDHARASGNLERLKQLSCTPFGDLTPAEKSELGQLTRSLDSYGERLHNELQELSECS